MAELEHDRPPFTPKRSFRKEPRFLVRAEGMYFWNQQGEHVDRICDTLRQTLQSV